MKGENGWFYLGIGGETETSPNTIVELRPQHHVGGFLYVLQTHRRVSMEMLIVFWEYCSIIIKFP